MIDPKKKFNFDLKSPDLINNLNYRMYYVARMSARHNYYLALLSIKTKHRALRKALTPIWLSVQNPAVSRYRSISIPSQGLMTYHGTYFVLKN